MKCLNKKFSRVCIRKYFVKIKFLFLKNILSLFFIAALLKPFYDFLFFIYFFLIHMSNIYIYSMSKYNQRNLV